MSVVRQGGRRTAAQRYKLIRSELVLQFMVQLAPVSDAEPRLATRGMGCVHHRILYFAHFAPGISVGELLSVLGVKHQNIQAPLRQLVREGYIQTRASVEDRRLKRLSCSRKGDRLLEPMSTGQHERIKRAYDDASSKDVEGYLRVMA